MRDGINFHETFMKNVTYDDIKSDYALRYLQTKYFLKYIYRVKEWIFLNITSILVFAELAIFHSIKIRTSLEKLVRKIIR